MNFTIKSTNGTVTIGTQEFNDTPINLTDVSCLVNPYFKDLFNAVESGVLQILKKGQVASNQLTIVSKLITKFDTDENDDDLLNEDYLQTKRFVRRNITDENVKNVMSSYVLRPNDGYDFYDEQRGELLVKLALGQVTKQSLKDIDKGVKDAKIDLVTGDFISAKDSIIASSLNGAYDQAYKDYYLAKLQVYIEANYPEEYWT